MSLEKRPLDAMKQGARRDPQLQRLGEIDLDQAGDYGTFIALSVLTDTNGAKNRILLAPLGSSCPPVVYPAVTLNAKRD